MRGVLFAGLYYAAVFAALVLLGVVKVQHESGAAACLSGLYLPKNHLHYACLRFTGG